MRTTPVLILTALLVACSNNGADNHQSHQIPDTASSGSKDSSKKSIPAEVKKAIGNTDITINYHSPAVRGRVIWGGLVPYDAVWVTGAHSATTLEVSKEFKAGEKLIPAGKYALFTIPGKEEWAIVINKNWNQHLADDYSPADDVVRIKVKPTPTEELTERLKYEVEQAGERKANIIISWERLRIPFGIEVGY